MRAITQCVRIAQQVRFLSLSARNNKNTREKSCPLSHLLYLLFFGIALKCAHFPIFSRTQPTSQQRTTRHERPRHTD